MPFRDVVGHRPLLTLLSRAVARDSLTPSLILSGPEGVGKRLSALALAQALNCVTAAGSPDGFERDGCGECAACRRVLRGAHADVLIIEPGDSGSIKIEPVRAAMDAAGYRPFEGRRRVTVIDDAEELVGAAQNALLKTLEEPPPSSVFVLVTSQPDMLLPTVRSRCAHLRFGRLNVADVAAVLERSHKYSRADALTAAAASHGSVKGALELRTGDLADARSEAESLLRVSGRDPRTRLDQAKELLKGSGSAPQEREHLGARLQALSTLLRDLGLLASGGDARFLANIDRRQELGALARTLGPERVEKSFLAVTRAYDALERNVSPKVVADWLAIQL
jgi:DNA polymerase-3 subunit delta'